MKSMRRFLILVLVLASAALVALGMYRPQSTQVNGRVVLKQADGSVMVNNASAISGATVFSDSTVTTGQNSSAVVSLGKLGRVEIHQETSIKLSYTESSVTVRMLGDDTSAAAATQGRGLFILSTDAGVAGTAMTDDAQVITDSTRKNEFTVDTSCGDTLVSVKKGAVTLRAGNSVKQIAAGSQDSAGTATPGCMRH